MSLSRSIPPQLPDLFHGNLVVMGRYTGKGPAAIKLTGQVGKETKEFVYEVTFPDKTGDDTTLWSSCGRARSATCSTRFGPTARRELVDEVVALAKKYGITTPYTSWLIVPDGPCRWAQAARGGRPDVRFASMGPRPACGFGGGGLSAGPRDR